MKKKVIGQKVTVKKVAIAQPAHATYGFSSMKRIIECPASVYRNQGIKEVVKAYSKEGTAAHEVVEAMTAALLSGNKFPALLGTRAKNGVLIDKEMIRHGKNYARYCHSVIEPYLHLPHHWAIEKKVVLDKDLDVWGTADFVFTYQQDNEWHIIIIDYKYGMGVEVESEDNIQLIGYVLAAAVEFEKEFGKLALTGEFHVFQPRMDHDPEPQTYDIDDLIDNFIPPMQEAIETSERLIKIGKKVKTEADRILFEKELTKNQKAGEHCRFCKFAGGCRTRADSTGIGKAIAAYVAAKPKLDKIQKRFDAEHEIAKKEVAAQRKENKRIAKENGTEPVEVESAVKKVAVEDPTLVQDAAKLSDEELAWFAINASKLSSFIESVKDYLKLLLESGATNEHVMLGSVSPIRELDDENPEVLIGELIKRGIDEPVTMVEKMITLTEVEKILGKGSVDDLVRVKGTRSSVVLKDSGYEPAVPKSLKIKAMLGLVK